MYSISILKDLKGKDLHGVQKNKGINLNFKGFDQNPIRTLREFIKVFRNSNIFY